MFTPIDKIGFNLATIAALLDRNADTDTGVNVAFAYDHEEAARFVAVDLRMIQSTWTGSPAELEHVRAFARKA